MKLIIGLFLMLGSFATYAGSVQLAWDASLSTETKGYKIYFGTASKVYGTPIDVGNVLTYNVTGLTSGKLYFFSATAYNATGLESVFSNETSYTVPMLPPINLRITSAIALTAQPNADLIVESSPDLSTWTDFASITADANGKSLYEIDTTKPKEFFRARYASLELAQAQTRPTQTAEVSAPTVLKRVRSLFSYKPGHHADERKGAQLLKSVSLR